MRETSYYQYVAARLCFNPLNLINYSIYLLFYLTYILSACNGRYILYDAYGDEFINDKNLDTLKIMNVAKNMFSAEYVISIAFETTSFSSQNC